MLKDRSDSTETDPPYDIAEEKTFPFTSRLVKLYPVLVYVYQIS